MGCQMNQLDSELVMGLLRACGHELVDDDRAADVVLYNTCSVRKHAEQKVLSLLGADAQRKAAGRKFLVGVLGCMAQRMGESLRQHYPQVDIVCSPGRLDRLPELIELAAGGSPAVALEPPRGRPRDPADDAGIDELDSGRDVTMASADVELPGRSNPAGAYVRVMRGCDKFCSYCVVPMVRGPERSRDPSHIVEEARRLVESGRSEITLLGQTVNSYRHVQGETAVSFSDLLTRVSDIPGLRRLRFVTSHPRDFGDDILHVMRDRKNICPYIHVPAQSGSDAVLARMNRRYTVAEYIDLVDRARAIVPCVVLAGDFIVGFPGETEEDHLASAELIRRSGYKNSFLFKYSPRPGTLAAKKYDDDIPNEVKKRRNNELLAVQAEVSLAHHRQYLGATVEALVEGLSPKSVKQARRGQLGTDAKRQFVSRTAGDHIVLFDADESFTAKYVRVRITGATALTLQGELVESLP
jgi:tRNA-2-methylthio-N6-dimethylallyladenosine synthase